MRYGCDAIYLDSECATGDCSSPCSTNCSETRTLSLNDQITPHCPTECELEQLAQCAITNPLTGKILECVDPIEALRGAWFLISCLKWCNKCVDPGTLLILAAAHLTELGNLQLASSTAQTNAAVKGSVNPAIFADPNHWNLSLPGKLFIERRPQSIGAGGAAIW